MGLSGVLALMALPCGNKCRRRRPRCNEFRNGWQETMGLEGLPPFSAVSERVSEHWSTAKTEPPTRFESSSAVSHTPPVYRRPTLEVVVPDISRTTLPQYRRFAGAVHDPTSPRPSSAVPHRPGFPRLSAFLRRLFLSFFFLSSACQFGEEVPG